jgi:hypothetical protein
MTYYHPGAACLVALASCSLLAAGAELVAPEIRDDGKFFSAEAVKKANERIAEISRKYDRDVLIETFATVPAGDIDKVKTMDDKERTTYFLGWAKRRAHERVVNGVYILICKEPRNLRVGVVEREPHKFPPDTRAAIEKVLMKEFADMHFDEGLDQAVRVVEERLAKGKQ